MSAVAPTGALLSSELNVHVGSKWIFKASGKKGRRGHSGISIQVKHRPFLVLTVGTLPELLLEVCCS